jgi:hypothetical protein
MHDGPGSISTRGSCLTRPADSNDSEGTRMIESTQAVDRAEDQAIEALIASIQRKIDAAVAARKTTTVDIVNAIRQREVQHG